MIEGFDAIPGETPIDDISGLRLRGIHCRSQLNAAEAENIRKVVLRYLLATPTRRQAPIDLPWCFKLHKQMFGDVWKWAGTPRRVELNLGVPAYRIEVDLQSLLDDLAYWKAHGDMPLVEQAARLHHRAVLIHPFLNGNGRWARMLANIYLKRQKAPLTVWPDRAIGQSSPIRQEYLEAIRAADGGDYCALIEMHSQYAR
ncbi:MAG TPA: mobile mystery protein B [Humisphaera sp.]|jgi:Fic-DOC domain mobile mystery protein B|nr:mobile mystery protein B [Humisphaera sp.]